MSPVVIPPVSVDDAESLILDGLQLNDEITLSLESLVMTPPAKRPEWVSGADSQGAILARDPRYENRVIEARLQIAPQATMNAALLLIAAVEDKLQECARNQPYGRPLVWDPAGSTLTPLTFRCLSGEITDMPIDWAGGWLARSPTITLRLTCLPFGEGTEYLAATVTSSAPLASVEVTGVPGDVDALGRLVVTDAATQSRRHIQWGLESRYYPPAGAAPALLIDAAALQYIYAGAPGTRAGAYTAASQVVSATLTAQPNPICGLGNLLTHVGSFRAQLRFYATAKTIAVRLTFQTLDGPLRSLPYKIPVIVGWNHVDLGLITIPETVLGAQRWTGRLEAYSTAAGGELLDIDYVALIPAELYGRARANYSYVPGWIKGRDEFTGATAGFILSGRVAPQGGSWTTFGDPTDFVTADGPTATDETVSRSATGTRHGILGGVFYTDVDISALVYGDVTGPGAISFSAGVIARWVDVSNYLSADYIPSPTGDVDEIRVTQVIAGVASTLATITIPAGVQQWHGIRLVAFAGGHGALMVLDVAGNILQSTPFASTALATGGVLATGRIGLLDTGGSASSRYYDNLSVARPDPEGVVCHASQSIEFRHDTTQREDSTGVYAGQPPEYVGARFTVPPSGVAGRLARVAVMAKRNDVQVASDANTGDSTTVQVYVVPRYLAVPR